LRHSALAQRRPISQRSQSGSSYNIQHNVQRAARRCAEVSVERAAARSGCPRGAAFSAPRRRRDGPDCPRHGAPAPGRHHDPTISPYASCCSPSNPSRQAGLRKQKTWAVISLAAGVRMAAGERRGQRKADSAARRCLLAAHGCSRVSSAPTWRRRKRHGRKQPRRPRYASLTTKKIRVELASRRPPARQSRNPEQCCGSQRRRSQRRTLPFKCRQPGNRAPRARV